MAEISGLPPNKRYIATHDENGKSIHTSSPDQVYTAVTPGIAAARSYAVPNVPVKLAGDVDMKAYMSGPEVATSFQRKEIVIPSEGGQNNGAHLGIVDFAPGAFSGMHRTASVDYSICVIGQIIHEVDSGERVTLNPGDHIIQRGTMHRWINASKTEPARLMAVTLPCKPFEVAGRTVDKEEWLADEPGYAPVV